MLARIERQPALISEGPAREAAKDAVIVALQARAEAQDAKIEALDQLVSELIAKTGRDSQNSSRPPSSDGPGTRADRRREERERRKTEPVPIENRNRVATWVLRDVKRRACNR